MKVGLINGNDEQLNGRLNLVKPAVKKLWYRGELRREMLQKTVAVVGSRRMSRYGRSVIEEIVPRLCGAGYTIVSGLMYGVDQLAHKKTLECGGVAVAVLGWGISRNNDPESDRLADQIVSHSGVVLSEYPDDTRGQLWTFPQRNRVVVGLSDLIIVVEAGIKSGTMSTVRWANKMNKMIFAVPGSIFSKTSEGANYLIENGLARPLNAQTLQEICGSRVVQLEDSVTVKLSEGEKRILLRLREVGPGSANEIARGLDMNMSEVLPILATLELTKKVTEEKGMWEVT